MLVLSRKQNESIIIGSNVEVGVQEVGEDREVTLVIRIPSSIPFSYKEKRGIPIKNLISRKTDESILIGDNVEVMIVGVDNVGQVKLGVRAPREIEIKRSELLSPLEKNLVKILA